MPSAQASPQSGCGILRLPKTSKQNPSISFPIVDGKTENSHRATTFIVDTLKIEVDENGIKLDAEGINGDGNPTHVEYNAKFDGKDYPVTGVPNADKVSVKRIDASTIQSTLKKGDQVVMTVTSVVSNYGKTRTSTFKGKNAQGQDVNNVVVYDKQ